ncbi:MAG: host attachment protein [Gammaproteobacteria bacterium]
MTICVIVADGSRARVLLAEHGDSPLTELQDFVHPESRLREQDLITDLPGRGSDSGGPGKHTMGQENTTRRKEVDDFARELGAEIDKLCRKTHPHRIYLVASPKLLGHLRAALSKQSADLIAGEIDKDLVRHDLDAIRSHLPKRM